MIRVLVVDDHPVVRRGIADLLDSAADIEVVGATGAGADAAPLSSSVHPDVVLMDIEMPNVDGVEATRRILEVEPTAVVVILTTFADHDRITRALDAGAAGYLLKDADPDEIIRGIRAAAAGDVPISPRAARELVATRRPRPDAALTDREREVLGLVADGLANKAIARRLGIAEKTVKAHLTRVFAALGVTDRTQAAIWATRYLQR
jgi:Response regulator containing a CheY-like receiver domain and an HTH DNA-binding domain